MSLVPRSARSSVRCVLSFSATLLFSPSFFVSYGEAEAWSSQGCRRLIIPGTQLLAIWFVTQWLAAGSPQKVRLIELGPGKGTLLADILRVRSLSSSRSPSRLFAYLFHSTSSSRRLSPPSLPPLVPPSPQSTSSSPPPCSVAFKQQRCTKSVPARSGQSGTAM